MRTERIEKLIQDVNIHEIADHLNEESLWNWCGAWREEAKEAVDDMKHDSINSLAEAIHANAINHGWWDDKRPFGEIIALCHSELSEALEAYRNGEDMVWLNGNKPDGIAVEMCDCVIRIFDYLAEEGIDIESVLKQKHDYNKTRSYKHGGKAI